MFAVVRKKTITLSLASLLATNLNGAGIPVIDAGSIAQSIAQYGQMIKQYEQMIKDTINFEKQMKELGVDMANISQILGESNQMIQDTKNLYGNIKAIPNDFYGEIANITRACNFIEKQSTFFKTKIKTIGIKYEDRLNACLSAITDGAEISKTLEELMQKAQRTTNPTFFKEIQIEIQNLINAKEYIQNKEKQKKVSTILSFYDNFKKNDSNNPYTKVKMDKDLKELSRQLSKPNNAKQAQALTNAILLKILEMIQKQYELNVNFANTMIAFNNKRENQFNGNIDFNKKYIETINPIKFNPFYQDIEKNLSKDEFGLPQYNIK